MTHPAFESLRDELQRSFCDEYDELKSQYDQRLHEEIQVRQRASWLSGEQSKPTTPIYRLTFSFQKSLDDLEQNHRTEIDTLKKDFEQTLNESLLDLKRELEEKAQLAVSASPPTFDTI